MSREDYAALPDELTLREVKVGKKTLVTSFLCPRKVCKRALGRLFQQRWHVELDLRAIKATLQMAELSCNTPQMNEKEVWVLSRLQPDPPAHGASGTHRRCARTQFELQTYGAAVE